MLYLLQQLLEALPNTKTFMLEFQQLAQDAGYEVELHKTEHNGEHAYFSVQADDDILQHFCAVFYEDHPDDQVFHLLEHDGDGPLYTRDHYDFDDSGVQGTEFRTPAELVDCVEWRMPTGA